MSYQNVILAKLLQKRFFRFFYITQKFSKKSVLTIEWFDPIMIGGLWIPEMIEIAGGSCLLATPGEPALSVTRENLTNINPDVVIVKPCGYKLEQTLQELEMLNQTHGM